MEEGQGCLIWFKEGSDLFRVIVPRGVFAAVGVRRITETATARTGGVGRGAVARRSAFSTARAACRRAGCIDIAVST